MEQALDAVDDYLAVRAGSLFAPVIDQVASSPQLGSRPLELLGIDPFAETPLNLHALGKGLA